MVSNELLILTLDYAPLMKKGTLELYLLYRSLQDEEGIVDATYNHLNEHTGNSLSTIAEYKNTLIELGLIEQVKREELQGPTCFSPYKKEFVRVLPLMPLSNEKRKREFKKRGRIIDTEVRRKVLDAKKLPNNYGRLLDESEQMRLLDMLGRDKYTLHHIVNALNFDKAQVKLWLTNQEFKNELLRIMRKVAQTADQKEVKEEIAAFKLKKRKKAKKKVPTFDEIYETLMKGSHRNGKEIPIERWQPFQFFRYFCIRYEKVYGQRFQFESKANPFSLRELKDMMLVMRGFNNDAVEVVKYLDWVFDVKSKEMHLDGTAILHHQRMFNEYRRRGSEAIKHCELDPIDQEFVDWVDKNVPVLFDTYDLTCMKDLYWLKRAYDSGSSTEEVHSVIEEGIRRNLIPREGNIEFR